MYNKCFTLFFFNFIFKLYNIVLVLPYIEMNPTQVYMCSPSWTLLHPPSPYHPSGSSQCTSPKHPVSCIEPGLVTRFIYDIIHVSMPFSQIIPPSPSGNDLKKKRWDLNNTLKQQEKKKIEYAFWQMDGTASECCKGVGSFSRLFVLIGICRSPKSPAS